MKPLPIELERFISKDSFDPNKVLSPNKRNKLYTAGKNFLRSSMDEVRLFHAHKFSYIIYELIEDDMLNGLNLNILRREITQHISYYNQRDHTAHTLYNYLLGYYIYRNSKVFSKSLNKEFDQRLITRKYRFYNVWPYVSLLHDIGYVLEGSIKALATEHQHDFIKSGTRLLNDFFQFDFWEGLGFDSVYKKQEILKYLKIEEITINDSSIESVANSLRDLGDLSNIFAGINNIVKEKFAGDKLKLIHFQEPIPWDTFDLWILHYKFYKKNKMVKRIQFLQEYYNCLLNEGRQDNKTKMLDHGIASGLFMLLYYSYYYKIRRGLDNFKYDIDLSKDRKKIFNEFVKINDPEKLVERYQTDNKLFWWENIVWATACTALHNYQEMTGEWVEGYPGLLNYSNDGDALCYLGILVDILQIWDRYTVNRESVITGKLPIEGNKVRLGKSTSGKIKVSYPDKEIANDIKNKLNKSLANWKEIVKIEYHNPLIG